MSAPRPQRDDVVVMKFGGTSVEDAVAIARTAGIVASRRDKGLRPLVVVSAMAKVTDALLTAADAAGQGATAGTTPGDRGEAGERRCKCPSLKHAARRV